MELQKDWLNFEHEKHEKEIEVLDLKYKVKEISIPMMLPKMQAERQASKQQQQKNK